jgi:cysteine desulfurase / selenocysteine lyase
MTIKENIHHIRKDFPLLSEKMNDQPLIYFDNAATTQKPLSVVEAVSDFYLRSNANVHRGNYQLSVLATELFEKARNTVQNCINAKHKEEIIFTRGTSESINALSTVFGKAFIHENDEVLITEMEHHSNLVPWQFLCELHKARLRYIPVNRNGELELEEIEQYFSPQTKILAITHVSNVLGTINPLKEIISAAHKHNIPVLIDGAQALSHIPVDVQDLDCDFYAFSAHKIYGPTGIGVLYGKKNYLEQMPPYMGGGEMIDQVSFEKSSFNELPYKFEAGTPNIAGALGMMKAMEYLQNISYEDLWNYEHELLVYAEEKLLQIPKLKIFGTASHKTSVISFNIDGIHHNDLAVLLDKMGVALRSGYHCAMPLMHKFNIHGTLRVSFALYNIKEEIDFFIKKLHKAIAMLS